MTLPPQPSLAPWLQTQLQSLLKQRGHAWLLAGPSGLGQFRLALALAKAWLCEASTPNGACNVCGSCHALNVHTHADLAMLIPEVLSLELGWPLDEKTQRDLDEKKRKPSKEIKVEAARGMVSFTQFTRSRGTTKVVLVFPAERMNLITANTLLKTLEEPPGAVKFVLATEAVHQLLPTIRSRCLGHSMVWPGFDEALDWLQAASALGQGDDKKATKPIKPASLDDLKTLLNAAGGRPQDALVWVQTGHVETAAQSWQALPKAMAAGNVAALGDFLPAEAVDALQKVCHDVWAVAVGSQPRFFSLADLPAGATKSSMPALSAWAKELSASKRTVEHPYNPGLMLEALASRAQIALGSR